MDVGKNAPHIGRGKPIGIHDVTGHMRTALKMSKLLLVVVVMASACTDASPPVSVELEHEPKLEDMVAAMVREGEMSQTSARIFLTAVALKPGQVLVVRDVGDEPDGELLRSLGVIGDPPVELYLVKREPESQGTGS